MFAAVCAAAVWYCWLCVLLLCGAVAAVAVVFFFAVKKQPVSEQLLTVIHLGSPFRKIALNIHLWSPFGMVALNKRVSLDVVEIYTVGEVTRMLNPGVVCRFPVN
jgi:hypothetical protein